jgi:hypothetical protein
MVDIVIASRKRRILAFLIDHIIFSFLAGILVFFVLGSNWDEATPISIMMNMFIILPPIFIIYFCKDSVRGMSLGRYILGIAVRNRADPNSVPSILRVGVFGVESRIFNPAVADTEQGPIDVSLIFANA